jgi:hydroxymethylpyrimidine pyrophosphatase-like HAD family hydrolase
MLEYAGLGIAMGNAADEVKTIAKKVVSDNDSDGVAEAIESFILK